MSSLALGIDGSQAEGDGGAPPPAIRLERVSKTYPGTRALNDISLCMKAGEIHALVGENGSGKSTLVKVLSGQIPGDKGSRIEVWGQELVQGDPGRSRDLKIAAIHQELMMVPELSALENVFLGDLKRQGPFVDYRSMRREFRELAAKLNVPVPADIAVKDLPISQQTLIEIMRAVRQTARIVLLDEPTMTLGVGHREMLYEILRQLRKEKVCCVFISHDLDEVMHIADRITVFRDGHHSRTSPAEEWDKSLLIAEMLGSASAAGSLGKALEGRSPARSASGGPQREALGVSNVRNGGKLSISELTVAEGEIVGLAGLVGSGRTSLLRAIAGADKGCSGSMRIYGAAVRWPRNVAEAISYGVALLPEDRKGQGLVLDLAAHENVTLSELRSVSAHGFLKLSAGRRRGAELLTDLDFRGDISGPVRTLSGGNQQKVLVSKWIHRGPPLLLIDEPTRGVDVGAKQDIMRAIQKLATRGHAIIWVSSELEEIAAVSHRTVVLSGGQVVRELKGREITVRNMLEGAFEQMS